MRYALLCRSIQICIILGQQELNMLTQSVGSVTGMSTQSFTACCLLRWYGEGCVDDRLSLLVNWVILYSFMLKISRLSRHSPKSLSKLFLVLLAEVDFYQPPSSEVMVRVCSVTSTCNNSVLCRDTVSVLRTWISLS